MKLTICGAGNAAHTLAPILAAGGSHDVTVFTPVPGEAARWQTLLGHDGTVDLDMPDGSRLTGRPGLVTDDPLLACVSADLILLALPAFAHESVLKSLAPHLPGDALIVALPARGGLDWLVRQVLPGHHGAIAGLQTLPWACRIHEWGRRAEVLGTKAQVDLAAWPSQAAMEVATLLTRLIGVPLRPASSFLALTLANTGQIIHPGIMYGLFHGWDGLPFGDDEIPLFYGGVTDEIAELLQALSDEVQRLRVGLQQDAPEIDLRSVLPLHDWLQRAYPDQIGDASTLQTCFNSNRAYAGLRAPVRPADGSSQRYEPWFASRYLSEDVPFGLLVTRGIAEIVGVATPVIDRVILWSQALLGAEYLVDELVAGQDVTASRAPQRFGLHDIRGLLQ